AYALGALSSGAASPGAKVRVSEEAPAGRAPSTPAAAGREPFFRGPRLDLTAVDLAAGDVIGDGAPEAIVAGRNSVEAFRVHLDSRPWERVCSLHLEEKGARIVSLETADLDGSGRDAVFLTVDDGLGRRVETEVLSCRD